MTKLILENGYPVRTPLRYRYDWYRYILFDTSTAGPGGFRTSTRGGNPSRPSTAAGIRLPVSAGIHPYG